MNKATTLRSAGLAVCALALIAVSGFIGFGVGAQGHGATNAGPARSASDGQCNLRITGGSGAQARVAVYDDPVFSSSATSYGRIADLSCTDAEILEWREMRVAAGLDAQVCRPVLYNDTLMARVYPFGCAVPTLVVSGEPR